jgi:hypothetical protein
MGARIIAVPRSREVGNTRRISPVAQQGETVEGASVTFE